jgi:hypothetical protein
MGEISADFGPREEWKGEKRKKKKGEMKVRMGLSSPSL